MAEDTVISGEFGDNPSMNIANTNQTNPPVDFDLKALFDSLKKDDNYKNNIPDTYEKFANGLRKNRDLANRVFETLKSDKKYSEYIPFSDFDEAYKYFGGAEPLKKKEPSTPLVSPISAVSGSEVQSTLKTIEGKVVDNLPIGEETIPYTLEAVQKEKEDEIILGKKEAEQIGKISTDITNDIKKNVNQLSLGAKQLGLSVLPKVNPQDVDKIMQESAQKNADVNRIIQEANKTVKPFFETKSKEISQSILSNPKYNSYRAEYEGLTQEYNSINSQTFNLQEKGNILSTELNDLSKKYEQTNLDLQNLQSKLQKQVDLNQISANEANKILSQEIKKSEELFNKIKNKETQFDLEYTQPSLLLQERIKQYEDKSNALKQISGNLDSEYKKEYDAKMKDVENEYRKKIESDIQTATSPKTNYLQQLGIEDKFKTVVKSAGFDFLPFEEKKNLINKAYIYAGQELLKKNPKATASDLMDLKKEIDSKYGMSLLITPKGEISSYYFKKVAEESMVDIDERIERYENFISNTLNQGQLTRNVDSEKNREFEYIKRELANLKQAKERLIEINEMPDDDPRLKDFIDGFYNHSLEKKIPFLSGLIGVAESARLYKAATTDEESLTLSQKELLKAQGLLQGYTSSQSKLGYDNIYYDAGKATSESLAFMGEILATRGIATGTRKLIEKGIAKVLKDRAESKAVQLITKPFSVALQEIARTSVNPARTISGTFDRMTPEMTLALSDEGDEFVAKVDRNSGESFETALIKALGTQWAENFSERLGGTPAFFSKISPAFAEYMKRVSIAHYMRKFGLTTAEFLNRLQNGLNYNGILGEIGEEIANMPLTNIITGDYQNSPLEGIIKYKSDGSIDLDWDNLATIGLSTAAISAPMTTLSLMTVKKDTTKVSYTDINGLKENIEIPTYVLKALSELDKMGFYAIEQFIRKEFPKLQLDGKERYVAYSIAKAIQNKKANERIGYGEIPTTDEKILQELETAMQNISPDIANDIMRNISDDKKSFNETVTSLSPITEVEQLNIPQDEKGNEKRDEQGYDAQDIRQGKNAFDNQVEVGTEEKVVEGGVTAPTSEISAEQGKATPLQTEEESKVEEVTPQAGVVGGEATPTSQRPSSDEIEAKDAAKAVESSLKKSNIKVNFLSNEEFDKIASESGLDLDEKSRSLNNGLFVSTTGEIYIAPERFEKGWGSTVVFHEGTHPILNIIENTDKQRYDTVVNGMKSFANTAEGKKILGGVMSFIESYSEESKDGEMLTETIAQIASGKIKLEQLPKTLYVQIAEFLNKISQMLGIGDVLNIEDIDQRKFIELSNQIASVLKEGRDISEIVGEENVTQFAYAQEPVKLSISPDFKGENLTNIKDSYPLSFVKKGDLIDIESLIKEIVSKNQKVWFWVADQLGRGYYFDEVLNGEHYLDAGISYALDPKNRNKGIIWATGLEEGRLKNLLNEADYIFIISGSPIASKFFNKAVFDLYAKRIGDYESFKNEVLDSNPPKAFKEVLEAHNSWESLIEDSSMDDPKKKIIGTGRKKFLIAINKVSDKKKSKVYDVLLKRNAFVDVNSIRDGFLVDNNFEINDIMLVLKPTGIGGKAEHSTYQTNILGEVIGVPDKKIDAFQIQKDSIKESGKNLGKSQQQMKIVGYSGAKVLEIQASKGKRGGNLIEDTSKEKFMTEDGEGNYVFYHYSNNDLTKRGIDPNKFGRNPITGRDEVPLAPASFYYTEPDVKESGLGRYEHIVKIPKNRVYPFNEDPLDFYDEAKRRFKEEYPKLAFDANKQIAWMSLVAQDNGYDMIVGDWGGAKGNIPLRAQSSIKLMPKLASKPVLGSSNQININEKLQYESNRNKPQASFGKREAAIQEELLTPKQEEYAVQERSAEEEVSRIGEAGQNIPESREGIRPSEQREEATQESQAQEKVEAIAQQTGTTAKNIKDLYNINRSLFGLDREKSLAIAIAMDRMVGAMAKRAGITKEQMYGRLKFEKASEEFVKGLSAKGKVLFQLVGENAQLAQDVRDNLQVARDMETAGKDAKTIRLATGWEKGKDDKWRYEILDGKLKIENSKWYEGKTKNIEGGILSKLEDVLENKELFDSYPQLRGLQVIFDKNTNVGNAEFTDGSIYVPYDQIFIGKDSLKSLLIHEIQHAIQDIEGFAKGGSPENYSEYEDFLLKSQVEQKQQLQNDIDKLNNEIKLNRESLKDSSLSEDIKKYIQKDIDNAKSKIDSLTFIRDSIKEGYFSNKEKYDSYKKLAGEVEARNVQTRMGMTPKQRRETLLSETEDVARDEQIVLFDSKGIQMQVDAWHGSPYQFDKFTTEKIGTGEGAQAFGWGLYFTDLESIAKDYAEKLGGVDAKIYANGKEVGYGHPLFDYQNFLLRANGDTEAVLNELKEIQQAESGFPENARTKARKKAIAFLEKNPKIKINANKVLYKVSIHKGKTPDQYNWLEWDKPVGKKIINELNLKLNNKLLGSTNFIKEKYSALDRLDKIGDGGIIYKAISRIFNYNDKQASLFLLENGIDGIKYPAESISRGATSDTARGFNYVVFDENAVSIEEVIKFQKDAEKARGAMMISMDGQAVIYVLTDPNVSTPLHEMAHVFEHYLTDAERTAVQSWAGTKAWTTQTSEAFARGFEKYLAEGTAPTPILQKIFDKFKQWMLDIYNGIVGSEIDIELNEPMRQIYSSMLGIEIQPKEKVEAQPTAPTTIKITDENVTKEIVDFNTINENPVIGQISEKLNILDSENISGLAKQMAKVQADNLIKSLNNPSITSLNDANKLLDLLTEKEFLIKRCD